MKLANLPLSVLQWRATEAKLAEEQEEEDGWESYRLSRQTVTAPLGLIKETDTARPVAWLATCPVESVNEDR